MYNGLDYTEYTVDKADSIYNIYMYTVSRWWQSRGVRSTGIQ